MTKENTEALEREVVQLKAQVDELRAAVLSLAAGDDGAVSTGTESSLLEWIPGGSGIDWSQFPWGFTEGVANGANFNKWTVNGGVVYAFDLGFFNASQTTVTITGTEASPTWVCARITAAGSTTIEVFASQPSLAGTNEIVVPLHRAYAETVGGVIYSRLKDVYHIGGALPCGFY